MKLIVNTDGGCRDNPGPGAWAFVLKYEDGTVKNFSGFLSHCSNNQSEYRALEAACLTLGMLPASELPDSIEIFSDSQLIVEQVNGRWQVKDEGLRPFFTSAHCAFMKLRERCPTTLTWFRREFNTEADALCNLVMDRHGIVCSKKGRSRDA